MFCTEKKERECFPEIHREGCIRFYQECKKKATQAYLELDGKNVDVLVKNIDFDPLTKKYMALDFQALVAGEIVSATVPIVYVNARQGTGYLRSRIVRGALQSRSRTSAGAR